MITSNIIYQVITYGGSYAGNLAAWFSVKYPHIVDGTVASSAPVTAEYNFTQYMDVVTNSIIYFEGIYIECFKYHLLIIYILYLLNIN
jgi:hypothetical protein